MNIIDHTPSTGHRAIFHCGQSITFSIELDSPATGGAWLRTNIGRADAYRREIIEHVELNQPLLARDWTDIPMHQKQDNPTCYTITLPLAEVGRFEAKAFFLPQDSTKPIWPDGDNIVIKVEPAQTVAGNSIYTAFVRQFGPRMHNSDSSQNCREAIEKLDSDGYTVIPKSGTFSRLVAELDLIIETMGFGIIQLLPIHPVPTTYARMGRFGSPFASIDFLDIDPALADFDRKTTPLDQFCNLADAVHARNARLFIDLPINHTGWASHLQIHHPEWFSRNHDSEFVSPGAWGVTWEDLSELDYTHRDLWQYMADVFLFWCSQGVDGFRCDAGYMVPLPVWEYIIAKVRIEYPNTVFMLEGLGGKISTTQNLLDRANMNWAYSEIFQAYDRSQLENYLPGAFHISRQYGNLVNFAETHDNNRLAAESKAYARMRTALAALTSDAGAFGITNGVEWFATAKVDVHGATPLNWGSSENQVKAIARLNQLLKTHPAFSAGTNLRLIQAGSGNAIAVLRTPATPAEALLALVNLDCRNQTSISWSADDFMPQQAYDLLTNTEKDIINTNGMLQLTLQPAEVICLSLSTEEISGTNSLAACATALEFYRRHAPLCHLAEQSPEELAQALTADPTEFCRQITQKPHSATITSWNWPHDLHRIVMLPDNHDLLIRAPHQFHAQIINNKTPLSVTGSIQANDGTYFAFLPTPNNCSAPQHLSLKTSVTLPDKSIKHDTSTILCLTDGTDATVTTNLDRKAVAGSTKCALLTNNRGAISQVRLEWSHIESQYDCILAANLHNAVPVDRQVLFTRCRAWVIHRDYSRTISTGCLDYVSTSPDLIAWNFSIPVGMGKSIRLKITLSLIQDQNHAAFSFERLPCHNTEFELEPNDPVTIILRPDIEDRNFHQTTKAYSGPEQFFAPAIKAAGDGFEFSPYGSHRLTVRLPQGEFIHEPEWSYTIPHPFEAQRGLDGSGDLFSPGYFKTKLTCNQSATLDIQALMQDEAPYSIPETPETDTPETQPLSDVMRSALKAYIVKRDDTRTVIAGYPWFLDWGRDTLICLRGIIAAELHEEARDILIQFARFEKQGTLPNMIRGNDDSNRDTTDAPLWFFTACADFTRANPKSDFLNTDCGGRTIRQVLTSIANHYIDGTPNGIKMDAASGLIFSPSHFTWMDTNFPAGTPREGYPIEIQALWFAALSFLASIDNSDRWNTLARQVKDSITKLYTLPDHNWLADCLLASPGTPASDATPDNALRPNQLFAITLGAIDNKSRAAKILAATECLLIPGAIRSLADRPVDPPLPIYRDGTLLNDPQNPYWGYYGDDEDTRRKPAYHNGTAWTWPFPSYCEALYKTGGEALRATATSILSSATTLANDGCIGHLPEILDANAPHTQRGCPAQAWGDTELYRVLKILTQ